MLKPKQTLPQYHLIRQPPSGGCVLKQSQQYLLDALAVQPPSGGCVLKPDTADTAYLERHQPPSGGCVLKLTAFMT